MAAAVVSGIARARHVALLVISLQAGLRQRLDTGALLAILGGGDGVVVRGTESLAVGVGEVGRGRESQGFGTEGLVAGVAGSSGGGGSSQKDGEVLHLVCWYLKE